MKSRLIYLINRMRRYRHAALFAFATRIVVFILGGIAIGFLSAWYMIDRGSPLTTTFSGSWSLWVHDGDVGADPYTLAHMARSGRLPVTSSNALYFVAKRDSEGDRLAMDCDYVLSGKPLDTDWWSLALYTEDGQPVKNSNGRSSMNSTTVLRLENGNYNIHLSKQVRPGNWIQISGREPIIIFLRLYGIHASKDFSRSNAIEQNLPVIRRMDCR